MNLSLRRVAFSGFAAWMVLLAVILYFIWPLRKTMRFGIDLVGGQYITLEVKTDKAVENALQDKLEAIMLTLKKAGKEAPKAYDVKADEMVLTFPSLQAANEALQIIKRDGRDLTFESQAETIKIHFTDNAIKRIKKDAVERTVEVLHNRLNKLSVAEIAIAPRGEKHIIIELPDVADPQQAKAMIGTAAVLEFKLVEREGASPDDILYEYDGQLPMGMEIVPGQAKGDETKHYYLVQKRAFVSGRDLKDAKPQINEQDATMAVAFTLTPEGGQKFYEVTAKNYHRQLAVVLDGVVITAPVIQAKISAHGQITGNFTPDEAKDLSMLLRSGSFVAPVTFEEERQVGPTLGAEAIRQGLIACLVGLALVFLFSVFFYSLSGILAFITLLYNLIFILAAMAWMKATLTLPGIAGMVLTIGMAIDASILIYERIREELKSGVSVRKAVNDGFSDAMRVIIDSNLTTFVVGVVLYYFGTGPIQGFAVTMMLGIASTLITGLFFLKALFNVILNNFSVQKLRI
jgi:preprotein translocase subunit SecD